MLQEREADVAALAEKLCVLQEEITSGAPTERKIFELAKAQAQREHTHNIKVDNRELAYQKIQETLSDKDLQLAELVSDFRVKKAVSLCCPCAYLLAGSGSLRSIDLVLSSILNSMYIPPKHHTNKDQTISSKFQVAFPVYKS